MGIRDFSQRLQGICEEQRVIRLDLFGSRARSLLAEGNDYDFAAEFPESSPSEYAGHYFGLLHALEDELQAHVDLINYNSFNTTIVLVLSTPSTFLNFLIMKLLRSSTSVANTLINKSVSPVTISAETTFGRLFIFLAASS